MGPQKQSLAFNFGQGLSLKTDPKLIPAGKFLELENSVFNKGGQLQKRNGFAQLTELSNTDATFLTTFNGNLTAISDTISARISSNNTWVDKGNIQPISLDILPLIRSNTNQSQADISISSSGLICTVYTDQDPSDLTQSIYRYVVADSITGQNVISPTTIPANGGGTLVGSPKVFNLGNYFIVLFTNHISSNYHLQFIAISTIELGSITSPVDITNNYSFNSHCAFDAVVVGPNLYITFGSNSGGLSVKSCYLTNSLAISSFLTFAGITATIVGSSTDGINIAVSFYDSTTQNGYSAVFNQALQVIMNPIQIINSLIALNVTSLLSSNTVYTYYEVENSYGYDIDVPTNFINSVSVPTSTSTPSSTITSIASLGLASKAFIINEMQYFLGAYQSNFQPTYFLINGSQSTRLHPVITAKLAYQNGGGYLNTGLPNAIVLENSVSIPYLIKDLVQSVSKATNVPAGTQINGIYSQTGINFVTFNFDTKKIDAVEIGSALELSGGFLWMYDGYLPVEQNFFLYPDNVEASSLNADGAMLSQQYFYQAVYEWTDNQGNAHRSAPSIPLEVDMSISNPAFPQPTPITFTGSATEGATLIPVSSISGLQIGQFVTDTSTPGNLQANSYIISIGTDSITLNLPVTADFVSDTLSVSSINSVTLGIPTLRLTYKTANPVKVVIYRWSTAQQQYYQVTSIEIPVLNDLSTDYILYVDTSADSTILGNNLIYTTGGVVENINAVANDILTLWQTRLFLVDSEDRNLIWYSKQVIENTPVEMSDLFTIYVAPTIGASGSTGPITALGAMDDKLIIFKKDAINYIGGTGPDNTGANNLFTDPIFITSVVGSTNQQSIINTPMGLMFQSDKGIWLLDRSLSTKYIGADVETIALSATVLSAVLVPGTNQVRFTLDNGITLMYDYYFDQWGTFKNVAGISSCIYQDMHTYLDNFGRVFQETPGLYLDGSVPVTMKFVTGWLNLSGISGYQRVYEFGLLGDYISPHLLEVLVAYDFRSPQQQSIIRPNNYTGFYGSDSLYGQTTPYGGPGSTEQWRVDTRIQKCQAFQITLNEIYDSSFGNLAGAGFTMTGINAVVGIKKSYRPFKGGNSVG